MSMSSALRTGTFTCLRPQITCRIRAGHIFNVQDDVAVCRRLLHHVNRSNGRKPSSSIFRQSFRRISNLGSSIPPKTLYTSIAVGSSAILFSFYLWGKSGKSLESSTETIEKKEEKEVLIPNLPEHIPYLIIGGGTAGFAACRTIRSSDPSAKVMIMTNESREPYMKPPLSKELWFAPPELATDLKFQQWDGRERHINFEKDEFFFPLEKLLERPHGGVTVVKNAEVDRLDIDAQVAYLKNGQSIKYDKVLIATGGDPKHLDVFDAAPDKIKDRIIYYRRLDDFHRIFTKFDTLDSIAIIGGGFLGSELACAIGRRSRHVKKEVKIMQIYREKGNLAHVLPQFLSDWVTTKVRAENVQVMPETTVQKVSPSKDGNVQMNLSDESSVEAQYVIVATGINPSIDIAEKSGLEIDPKLGGILVNSELQARSNVWVAGDAACFYDIKLGRRRVEHHDHAINSGRTAGQNMAGGKKAYKHQSMFWSDLGPEVAFEAVGIVDSSLETFSVLSKDEKETENEEPNRGVVFYLNQDKKVVGVLLMNLFNRLGVARRVINEGKSYKNLSEVAKHFSIFTLDE